MRACVITLAAVLLLAPAGAPAGSSRDAAAAYGRVVLDQRHGLASFWIGVADLDGHARAPIMERPKAPSWSAYSPVWSPDGSRLAFIRADRNRIGVWVAPVGGAAAHVLERLPGDYDVAGAAFDSLQIPAWSPDGLHVTYADGPLWIVGADGRGARRLVSSLACNPEWSPDGRSILYVSDPPSGRGCSHGGGMEGEPGYRVLNRVDADGAHRRLLARGSFGSAVWSPDGRRIAYTGECVTYHAPPEWNCALFVMSADGGAKQRLGAATDKWIAWADGGRALLYAAHIGGRSGVAVADLASHQRRMLRSGDVTVAGVSRDGRRIAVLRTRDPRGISIVDLAGRVIQRVVVPTGWTYSSADVFLP